MSWLTWEPLSSYSHSAKHLPCLMLKIPSLKSLLLWLKTCFPSKFSFNCHTPLYPRAWNHALLSSHLWPNPSPYSYTHTTTTHPQSGLVQRGQETSKSSSPRGGGDGLKEDHEVALNLRCRTQTYRGSLIQRCQEPWRRIFLSAVVNGEWILSSI